MDQLNELENTFIEEYESADLLIEHKKIKSSTILLSEALFALVDYIIFKKYNKLAKNHSERFRILQEKEQEIYSLVDCVWTEYTNSYSKPSVEKSIKLLKESIKKITENEAASERIKKIVE